METQQTAMTGELGAMIAPERLREIYADCLRTRLLLDAKITLKLRGQDDIGGFYIGGMGEEVHGAATAQALWDALELPIGQPAADALAQRKPKPPSREKEHQHHESRPRRFHPPLQPQQQLCRC